MNMKFLIPIAIFGLLVSTTGCKKDKEDSDAVFSADQQVSKDQNSADNEAEDIGAMQDDLMASNESKLMARIAADTVYTFQFDSCATVTLVPKGNNATGKVTVNYGTGCQGRDGRFRKGIVEWTFTDKLRKPGAVVTTKFIGYGVRAASSPAYTMIDNASTKVTTNTSSNEPLPGNAVITLKRDIAMKLVFPDNTTFNYIGTKNLSWNLGLLGYRWDNVYTLKAGSNLTGTDRQNRAYTLTVNQDVVRKASCALVGVYKPVSGKLTITHNSKTKVMDFGDGTCDNSVSVTINGKLTRTRW